ncbi:MAG: glycosyltransferase family 2 protein [Chloroflexi bacterium]|nr:glycosyltransferase family 2 protein [Chloroflexota bacterium]MCY3938269.1 glycosyltransferase family 2 protein [Chloroflexota bacterium]
MPKVSIAIVNFNGEALLRKNLPDVLRQDYQDFEIIVVDNGSTDGSVKLLEEEFPEVRVVRLEQNAGFAAGVNRAIESSNGDYVATLNNDARPNPDWLSNLVTFAEENADFGMIASKMVFDHDPAIINSAGISLDLAGIAWDRMVGDRGGGPSREIFGPSAGAALYRRRLFDDVGGFDESFFAYLEDVDLAWRARLAGWRCWYVATAAVRHEHSATAIEGSPFKNFHLGRNKILSILKNYPFPQLLLHAPLIVFYDLGAIPYTLVSRRDPSILLGRLAAFRELRKTLSSRRAIQRSRRVGWSGLSETMDGFYSPWTLFRRYSRLRSVLARRSAV